MKERTFVMIKPDGVQRSLIGEIIKRFEQTGLKLVHIKLMVPTKDQVEQFYTLEDGWLEAVGNKAIGGYTNKGETPPSDDPLVMGQKVLDSLRDYMTSGPVVVMVWQGMNAVAVAQKITGSTEPLTSDVGTIRGDFVIDSYMMANTDGRAVRNAIHRSGSVEEAQQEIAHWCNEDEIIEYRLVQEQILYDVNIDGILE